jgi:hypothetical protein
MPVGAGEVDHLELDLVLAVDEEKVEVLTAAVDTDVDLRNAEPRALLHLHACADLRERALENHRVHRFPSLGGWLRRGGRPSVHPRAWEIDAVAIPLAPP